MTMEDADAKVHLIDADSGPSRTFICVSRDAQPPRSDMEPARIAATVLVAIGRSDDRIARSFLIVHYQCTHA